MCHNTPDEWLRACSNHLMLHSCFTNNLGLYHGKIGIVLFFCYYARYTREILYDDFAGYLTDQLCEEMYDKISFDLEDGLCGIGWGITYLLQNNLMQGDPYDILYDIDAKIMEYDPQRIKEADLKSGLGGLFSYATCRLYHAYKNSTILPFDSSYLNSLYTAALRQPDIPGAPQYISSFKKEPLFTYPSGFLTSILPVPNLEADLTQYPLGLENGIAGMGLKLMMP